MAVSDEEAAEWSDAAYIEIMDKGELIRRLLDDRNERVAKIAALESIIRDAGDEALSGKHGVRRRVYSILTRPVP